MDPHQHHMVYHQTLINHHHLNMDHHNRDHNKIIYHQQILMFHQKINIFHQPINIFHQPITIKLHHQIMVHQLKQQPSSQNHQAIMVPHPKHNLVIAAVVMKVMNTVHQLNMILNIKLMIINLVMILDIWNHVMDPKL